MKKKKKFKIRWIVIPVIIIVVIVLVVAGMAGASQSMMSTEVVTNRDIVTYHSFTGVVKPVDEEELMPAAADMKILSIEVEEGDIVKPGDVIMYLDRKSIENQIEDLETSMSVNAASTALKVQQARNTYTNYKKDLEEGLNSQIITAEQAMVNAEITMNSAVRKYEDTVSMNSAGINQTLRSAKSKVDSAYISVRNAQEALYLADYNKHKNNTKLTQTEYENAERSLENAWINYNDAVAASKAASITEETNLANLYDQMVSAQSAYLSSVDSYNAVVRSTEEQLESYRLQYQQALMGSDTSVDDLKLARLYEKLDDCTVRASISGEVTKIPVEEGAMTEASKSLATITNFSKLKIDIKINEYDIKGASVGEDVTVILNAVGTEYDGKITKISRNAKSENGVSYFESEVEFDGDEDVRSGMSVEVHLITNELHDVPTLPNDVIQLRDDGTAYVLVYTEDHKTTEERDIECGVTDGTYTEITSGLKTGDEIVYMSLPTVDAEVML
ncbi:MAG: efflux RND transporter periplasmic adaptor subunit [Lachnospiraceae bacterium]|nr:efflux RND transporter periplasmic adaptor subunit [Lachnospiraceae bacterium]